jgi:hypothetical protein
MSASINLFDGKMFAKNCTYKIKVEFIAPQNNARSIGILD